MEKEITTLSDCFSKPYALPFNRIFPLRKQTIGRGKGLHWGSVLFDMVESYDLTGFADGMMDVTFNKDKSFWSHHIFELQLMLLKRLKATTGFEPQAVSYCCHHFR